jgi:hypothetical protein
MADFVFEEFDKLPFAILGLEIGRHPQSAQRLDLSHVTNSDCVMNAACGEPDWHDPDRFG